MLIAIAISIAQFISATRFLVYYELKVSMKDVKNRPLGIVAMFLMTLLLIACSGNNTPAQPTQLPPPPEAISDSAIKLSIVEDGIYQLTADELSDAGLSIDGLSSDALSLTLLGEQVPYLMLDDAILFYGEASESRYSRINPYILRTGEPGVLMSETAATAVDGDIYSVTQQVSAEQNWYYEQRAAEQAATLDSTPDVWFWQRVANVGDDAVFEFEIEIPAVASGYAELNLDLWGLTHIQDIEPDHDFDVLVNGEKIETVSFDGQTFFTSATAIETSVFREGTNTITIDNSVPGNARLDQFLFNSASLSYPGQPVAVDDRIRFNGAEGNITLTDFSVEPIILDITDSRAPMQITDAVDDDGSVSFGVSAEMQIVAAAEKGFLEVNSISPFIESDWRSTDNQADLLIVTTRALSPELEPLVAEREKQGLTVAVTHVDELYDAFGDGAVGPDAIHNFVKYAAENWAEPAPQYLFLVGDTTTDMLGNGATRPENPVSPPVNLVPSPIVEVSHAGETVADARLADVDGDLKPDLAVGRWPVDTAKDVENLVRRTIAYEQGEVSERTLFTYDGTSSEFSSFTERLIEQANIPAEHAEQFAGPTSSEVTEEWNEGAWLVSYVGHGSLNLWGSEEVLTQEAVSDIGSGGKTPPIVVQFTCLTGQFGYWEADSISETMLKTEGGPVLMVASTSLTLSTHQSPFAIAFIEGLQSADNERIGDALQAAKSILQTENNPGLQEISDTFGLIGDPSARITRPAPAVAGELVQDEG